VAGVLAILALAAGGGAAAGGVTGATRTALAGCVGGPGGKAGATGATRAIVLAGAGAAGAASVTRRICCCATALPARHPPASTAATDKRRAFRSALEFFIWGLILIRFCAESSRGLAPGDARRASLVWPAAAHDASGIESRRVCDFRRTARLPIHPSCGLRGNGAPGKMPDCAPAASDHRPRVTVQTFRPLREPGGTRRGFASRRAPDPG
jgi:hypothetical protein